MSDPAKADPKLNMTERGEFRICKSYGRQNLLVQIMQIFVVKIQLGKNHLVVSVFEGTPAFGFKRPHISLFGLGGGPGKNNAQFKGPCLRLRP